MVFWMLGDRGPGLNLGGRLLLTTPRRARRAGPVWDDTFNSRKGTKDELEEN
jgi:hypothetical protein